MKGPSLPSTSDLQHAIEHLTWGKIPSDEELVLWCQWARLDARLAQQIVVTLAESFRKINPFTLWLKNNESTQPQTLAALIDFAVSRARSADSPEITDFQAWRRTVVQGIKPSAPQMFYARHDAPLPESDRQKAETSLKSYRRWGFFGEEPIGELKPISPGQRRKPSTALAKPERLRALKSLIDSKTEFRVNDYIRACGGHVHRRMAERDLRECPRLRSRGATRGKWYRAKR